MVKTLGKVLDGALARTKQSVLVRNKRLVLQYRPSVKGKFYF